MYHPIKILDVPSVLSTYSKFPTWKNYSLSKWLPLYKNSELEKEFAFMIGKSIGDGHLDSKFTYKHTGIKRDMFELKKYLIKTFQLSSESLVIYDNTKHSKGVAFQLHINNALFGRILFLLGAPMGNKTNQSFQIPEWIFSDRINSRNFLMGLFEDELTTIKILEASRCARVMIKMTKNRLYLNELRLFLNQVKLMVERLGVECSDVSRKPINCQDSSKAELYLTIKRNKLNILNYRKNIGFKIYQKKIVELEKSCFIISNSIN